MTDIADQAAEIEQENLRIALRERKQQESPQPVGYCINPLCHDDLDNPAAIYCCGECAAEHARRSGR